MARKKDNATPQGEMTFLQHLEELRWHLVRSAIAITIGGVVAFLNKSLLFDGIIFYPRSPDFPT
ncbi:MAG: twin-arginine translocase subunit TatC, partial [Bacteroidota bacterium]|nr:twin-arginine translocase subunit TatC [Bacteroidota bacterium]